MAKRTDILKDLHNIINEGQASGNPDQPKLHLKRVINTLLTESDSNADMMNFLSPFNSALDRGTKEELLAEQLLEGMKKYTSIMPGAKKLYEQLSADIAKNIDDIKMTQLFEGIQSPEVRAFIESDYNAYMSSKTLDNKAKLGSLLESCSGIDNNAYMMLTYLRDNIIQNKTNVVNLYDDLNESEVIEFQGRKFVQNANGNMIPLQNLNEQELHEKIDAYVSKKLEEAEAEDEENAKDNDSTEELAEGKKYLKIDNGINLRESITKLRAINNNDLQDMLNLYESALNDGCREEMIVETFIKNLNERFERYDIVYKATQDLEDRITSHKTSFDLTKIFEVMSNDGTWSYMVPLIEDTVVSYQENPTVVNRNILLNHLRMYESCPYVWNILDAVRRDDSREGLLMRESQKFAEQNAHIEEVYSPVQYIKENECVFNVEGQFYVKKGTHVSKLNKDSIKNLSESFLALARLCNDPRVVISEAENKIYFNPTNGNDTFIINEGYVQIGENKESVDSLKNHLLEMHAKYNNYDDLTFLTAAFLCENFNNIAQVPFVKTIALNEGYEKTLDLFKIKNNIFVSAHDNVNEQHTFYRNVKPIQLKNIINDHFGIQVSSLFEDLLPNQEKIMKELNEIQKEYESKIDRLEEMYEKYSNAIRVETDEDSLKLFKKGLKDIEKELNEAKKEYKKFQVKLNKIENINEADTDTDTIANFFNDFEGSNSDDTTPEDDDFNMDAPAEDNDGSDGFEDISQEPDIDGSDLDLDFTDGSDENENEEYMSSDGDDLTAHIGDENDFETDPFGDDFDSSDASGDMSQDDDYNMDDTMTDEFGEPVEDEEDPTVTDDVTDDNNIDTLDDEAIDSEDDPFGADTDALGTEDIDNDNAGDVVGTDGETEPVSNDADLDYANFKIVKVDFDINVRTGERKNTGKTIVIVPMIDALGNKTSETRSIDFYITDIQGEKGVVLDTTGISVEMYNAVVDAIKNSSSFNEVESGEFPNGDEATEPTPIDNTIGVDEDPIDDEVDEDPEDPAIETEVEADVDVDQPKETETDVAPDPFNSDSDETTELTIDDGIEPHGIDVPTLSDEEDENDTIDSPILDIIPEGKKAKKKSKANTLNESLDDEMENDDIVLDTEELDDPENEVDQKITTSTEQDDPIAVIQDVLEAYEEDGGDIEVHEINDYDIDGVDVSSIGARIGDNEYTFFTLDQEIYCGLSEDFEEYSQEIDTLREWTSIDESEEDFDAPMSANVEIAEGDTESWVEFVTDIIATETGDQFDYELAEPIEDGEELEEATKVKINGKANVNGAKDAKIRLKKNSDLRQTTFKDGNIDDDSYAHYERTHGTSTERKNNRILRKKAKKAGVPVNPPQPQQENGMM